MNTDSTSMKRHQLPGEHVYKGLVMYQLFQPEVLDRVPEFEFREDDVLISTYPKAGTTWLQSITWLILNDLDRKTLKKTPLTERSMFLERIGFEEGSLPYIDVLPQEKSPRLIKTHLPYQFFKTNIENEEKPNFKVIVGLRNPKDTLVSYYHFYRMNAELGSFAGDFNDYFQLFKERRLAHGDYFDIVLSWWKERENQNILFVKYEDLKRNPKIEIAKIGKFLDKPLSASDIEHIIKETSFGNMRENFSTNICGNKFFDMNISPFIRKGEVGDWRNHFTEEQFQFVDDRCQQELTPLGLLLQDS